jgi:hypothetical protein
MSLRRSIGPETVSRKSRDPFLTQTSQIIRPITLSIRQRRIVSTSGSSGTRFLLFIEEKEN